MTPMTPEQRERKLEKNRTWARANYAKLKERTRQWRANNPDGVKAQTKRAYDRNREEIKRRGKLWREANPDKVKLMERKGHLREYGLTIEEYDLIAALQDNLCAICLRPETKRHQNGAVKRLAVDHCHKTNRVRGLLCGECNFAIGKMHDSPERLRMAADYLESAK